jgi:hypothetical protein
MPLFWQRAASILKSGGTVAIWTIGSAKIDSSTPNAGAIQATIDSLNDSELGPYYEPGNRMAHNLYIDLALPWNVTPPVTEFDEETYFRKEWGPQDGIKEMLESSAGADVTLDAMEKLWGTTSPVQRWRDANPEKAGTEEDIVKRFIAVIARLLHDAGVEVGNEKIKATLTGVLMMVKKKNA